jgi:N6-L-threonylcarbamoyladenine synthase
MRVLAIETSCDETGIAVIEGTEESGALRFRVVGNALLSQAALHAPYGGVYPSLAKREHQKNLPIMLEQALAGGEFEADAIAVTHGPGLEPALWTGIVFAQELAQKENLPLMGVNHMEGHLISSLVQDGTLKEIQFPVLGLLISGGHTEFVLMEDWFKYRIIGRTLDDAVGEAFDKVARLLDLPYPGGPEMSKLADKARKDGLTSVTPLPRPMLQSGSCDMSFSGLKTAALYALRNKTLTQDERAAFAREFEETVGDVFVAKTRAALIETGAKIFVIGGGVAANRYLRERLQALILEEFDDVEFRLPELSITGDNAIMIGEAALVHMLKEGLPADLGEDLHASGKLSLGE